MPTLAFDTYGKTRVRLMQVLRGSDGKHRVVELEVKVLFEGDFAATFETGDNSQVLPTDTMKNTVYAVARQKPIESVEAFAHDLAQFFLVRVGQLRQVTIEVSETPWNGIAGHGAAFEQSGNVRHIAVLIATREHRTLTCGITGLQILKTGDSAFAGFLRDEFTTLPDTNDRLLGTVLTADWSHCPGHSEFHDSRKQIVETLLDSFATHVSLSVQHTLYAMAQNVLEKHAFVREIHMTMPNKHCLLVDLSRFGLDNPNQIFVPTDEPSGYIEARLTR